MKNMKYIVIGIGEVGSAVCCHLPKRGVRVLGIEEFYVPNTKGVHMVFRAKSKSQFTLADTSIH